MLTYSFSEKGSESLYEYLYRCIKQDIMEGALAPGDRLPSKRSFAKHLNVSTITIENAYAQLLAEGYIYSIPKKGYYTADISWETPTGGLLPAPRETPTDRLLPASWKMPTGGLLPAPVDVNGSFSPKSSQPGGLLCPGQQKEAYFADFTSSQTHPDTFPFSIWAKLMREVIGDSRAALMENPPSGGILPLRQEISKYLRQFRGMDAAPEQIVVGAGTEYLYGLLIQLLGHEKIYGVEDPGYQKVSAIIKGCHAPCCHIPLDGQGIRIGCLEKSGAEVVHISPSHHFPTGIIMPASRRFQLLGWAAREGQRYIIEDDYDSEFRFMGRPIPALQSIDSMGKVIYMNTFAKTLASTIRISYMVLPWHLVERFYQEMGFYACTVSNFEQYTLTRFLQGGHFERHINRMRNFYHRQRDLLLGYLKGSPLSSRITITEEDAGLHFLMQVDTAASNGDIMQRAKAQGLCLSSLSQYYHNGCPPKAHTFLMNYASIPPGHMQEAISRLCRVFEGI